MIAKLLGGTFGPWIIGGALVIAGTGWAAAGVQTIRLKTSQVDLARAVVQVEADANKAANEVIAALLKKQEQERVELLAQIETHRQAVTSARDENLRLNAQLSDFGRELRDLHNEPETHDYLSVPVPDNVLNRLRVAQGSDQARVD